MSNSDFKGSTQKLNVLDWLAKAYYDWTYFLALKLIQIILDTATVKNLCRHRKGIMLLNV